MLFLLAIFGASNADLCYPCSEGVGQTFDLVAKHMCNGVEHTVCTQPVGSTLLHNVFVLYVSVKIFLYL